MPWLCKWCSHIRAFLAYAHLSVVSGSDPTKAAVRTVTRAPCGRLVQSRSTQPSGVAHPVPLLRCQPPDAGSWSGDPRIDDANPRRVALQKAAPTRASTPGRSSWHSKPPVPPHCLAFPGSFFCTVHSSVKCDTFGRSNFCRCPQARRQTPPSSPAAPPTTGTLPAMVMLQGRQY
jgi:hypothetical protein